MQGFCLRAKTLPISGASRSMKPVSSQSNWTGENMHSRRHHYHSGGHHVHHGPHAPGDGLVVVRVAERLFDDDSLCDIGAPDADLCQLASTTAAPAPGDGLGDRGTGEPGTRPILVRFFEARPGVLEEAWSRGKWLLGLLVLQSLSSVVLERYQDLIRDHIVVTLFLTMLVGAGGNAGNQSAIKVIRGLATGQIKGGDLTRVLRDQALVGVILASGLSAGGFVRVILTDGQLQNATAISLSLFLIVLTSVVLGTALPFGLAKIGVDPSNAGTSIQVVMDVAGVAITCSCCTLILDQLQTILTN